MERKPQLTSHETHVLLRYVLAIVGTVLLFLVLGWVRSGAPIRVASPHKAQIAVIVPLTGAGAEDGKVIINSVVQAKEYFSKKLELGEWDITVFTYDAGYTENSAAWAAFIAARNPDTVAIIGPMNATQVIAIKEAVRGRNIPILTPSSTTPTLEVSSDEGVYRIPATDELQGAAVVKTLARKTYTDVFMIVETNDYVKKIMDSFNKEASGRIKVVGIGDIKTTDQNTNFVPDLKKSQADAIVYLGGSKGLEMILKELKDNQIEIPIVGVDSINDPKLAGALSDHQELYFTSPFFVNSNKPGIYYSGLFLNDKMKPFSFESTQAVWLILTALSGGKDGNGRESVWENLPNSTIRGAFGANLKFVDGQLQPAYMYIYKGTNKEDTWFQSVDNSFKFQ